MSLSGNYSKVFYRIFPTEKPCWDLVKVKDKNKIYLRNLQQLSDPSKAKQPANFWEFLADGVFFNKSQEFVYSEVTGDVIERVTKGFNGIIAAFGQTGSGKSLTLAGLQLSEENLGLAPRAIKELFALKKNLPRNIKMCIQMSYGEFSKTQVFDLLKPYPNIVDVWHAKETLTKIKITSELDGLKLLYLGEGRKSSVEIGSYMSHDNSSVLTLYVTTIDVDFSQPYQTCSRLHFIDMAGVDTIGVEKNQRANVGYANLEKLNLEQFLSCLMTRNAGLIKIKQRINPLIYFLGNDLSNKSLIRFIGHIKILRENLPITMSMLRFGQHLRGFKPTQKEIECDLDPEFKIKYLQKQLEQLQKEKIQNSVLLNQDLTLNFSKDRMDHLQKTVNEYIKDCIDEINVMNVTDVSAVFKIFKEMCNDLEQDRLKLLRENKQYSSDLSVPKRAVSKISTSMSSLKMSTTKERRVSSSKKVSKRIKESPSGFDKKKSVEKVEKSTSVQSLVDQKYKHQSGRYDRSSGSIAILNKRRKSTSGKGSVANIKRNLSISKRKSIASVTTSDRFLSTDVHLLPPEYIPDNKEAWKFYINEPSYISLVEEYKNNEEYIIDMYSTYLENIKKLQDIKDVIENMKHDITEANVMRKFNVCTKARENKFAKTILSEAEVICKENLQSAQKEMLDQQETVLRSQTELKIYLNIRKDLKMRLHTDFENYCKEKYNVAMPNMKNLSEEEMIKDTKYSSEDKNVENVKKSTDSQLVNFKKLMMKERNKNEKSRHLSRITWTNLPTYV